MLCCCTGHHATTNSLCEKWQMLLFHTHVQMPARVYIRPSNHWHHALTRASVDCRAAEEELMATADERDALIPQMEEAKWHARKADRDRADLQSSFLAAQQARSISVGECLLFSTCIHWMSQQVRYCCASHVWSAQRLALLISVCISTILIAYNLWSDRG